MESPTRGGSSPERTADPGSSCGVISPDASRLRDVITFDHDSEVIDLSGCGLSDLKSLESCSRLSSLAVANNNLLSCDELCRLRRLWTLDLRGCGLTTVAPLVHLGALGELQLAHNRLLISAALKLHPMALGRLGLQGNPLLPDGVRTAMRVRSGADEARLLRSFLADSLPRVVALDDSFVTSAERKHCRDYFDGTPPGQAMRELLLEAQMEAVSDAPPPITCEQLRALSRAWDRSEALVTVFADCELLYDSSAEDKVAMDTRRLRWLAAEYDLNRQVIVADLNRRTAARAADAIRKATLPGGGGAAAASEAKEKAGVKLLPLSLVALSTRSWLSGPRKLNLMALLALSLHQPMPGPLVHEFLIATLAPELGPEHVSEVARLPPCLRAALLLLLTKRGHDGVSSESLWRFLSFGALMFDRDTPDAPQPIGAGLPTVSSGSSRPGTGPTTPTAALPSAASAAFELGYTECARHVRKLLKEMPSWTKYERPPTGGAGTGTGGAGTSPPPQTGGDAGDSGGDVGGDSRSQLLRMDRLNSAPPPNSPSSSVHPGPYVHPALSGRASRISLGSTYQAADGVAPDQPEQQQQQQQQQQQGQDEEKQQQDPQQEQHETEIDPHREPTPPSNEFLDVLAGDLSARDMMPPPSADGRPPPTPEGVEQMPPPTPPGNLMRTGRHRPSRGGGGGESEASGGAQPDLPPISHPVFSEGSGDNSRRVTPPVPHAPPSRGLSRAPLSPNASERSRLQTSGGDLGEGGDGAADGYMGLGGVAHPLVAGGGPTVPMSMPMRKIIGGASVGGLYADNSSWGPNFLIASNGANLRRAGGDTQTRRGLDPTTHRVAYSRWSPLEAPAYLLKRRDQTFLQVYHPDRPVPHAEVDGMGSGGGGGDADGGDGGGDSPDEELSDEQRQRLEELRGALLKQMHRVIDTFRRMDVNGDGRISMEEFRAVLPLLGPPRGGGGGQTKGGDASDGAATGGGGVGADAGADADADAAGRGAAGVTRAEAEGGQASFGHADTDAMFRVIDSDRSGTIDYNELNAVLRQGLSIKLSKRLQVGGAGEIALEAKNKIALRGAHPGADDDSDIDDEAAAAAGGGDGVFELTTTAALAPGGEGGGEGGGDGGGEGGGEGGGGGDCGGEGGGEPSATRSTARVPGRTGARVASNSTTNARLRATQAVAAAAAAREAANRSSAPLLVSPPVVGPSSRRSGQVVHSRHGSMDVGTTWFAVGGKNDFIMQPQRDQEVVRQTSQSQSKIWQSVQMVRQHTDSVSAIMHHNGMIHEAQWRQRRLASNGSKMHPMDASADRISRSKIGRGSQPTLQGGGGGGPGGRHSYSSSVTCGGGLATSASAPQLPHHAIVHRSSRRAGAQAAHEQEQGTLGYDDGNRVHMTSGGSKRGGGGGGPGVGSGGFGGEAGLPLRQMYRGYDHAEYAAAPWAPSIQTKALTQSSERRDKPPKESLASKPGGGAHVDVQVAATSSHLIGTEYSRGIASLTNSSHALSRNGSRPSSRSNMAVGFSL